MIAMSKTEHDELNLEIFRANRFLIARDKKRQKDQLPEI